MVVPFTIPTTRWTFVTTSDSRSTLITGIAAQTDASKRSCAPAAAAAAKSSAPWRATSCLFAVTTERPDPRSASTWPPAGSTPPMTSATIRIEGSSITSADVGRENALGGREVALLRRVANERANDPEAVPGRSLDLLALLLEQAMHRRADGAVAEKGYGNVNGRHSCPRAA